MQMQRILETDNTKKFTDLFCELEDCNEDRQKEKIVEMNEVMEEMNADEFLSIFNEEIFNKIHEMIEEKKLTLDNSILLLKHFGYNRTLKLKRLYEFEESQFYGIFEKMITEEDEKKEGKDEKLIADLSECILLFGGSSSLKLNSICVPCLLKVALKKEENEEVQKEVEMALITLSEIGYCNLEQKVYLNEITEIIKHQQKHRNLSHLAYQSAWEFFIYRFCTNGSLEDTIVNKLHFGREAARVQEELNRNVNWKKKEEKMNKKESKKIMIIRRWIQTHSFFFNNCYLWNEEFVELIASIVQIFRATKENYRRIGRACIDSLINAARNRAVKIEDLLESEAVDAVLDVVSQSHVINEQTLCYLYFFKSIFEKLKGRIAMKEEKDKQKELKRKVLEKMEEEGYEDCIIGFSCCKIIIQHYIYNLVPPIDDFFVYC